MRALNQLIMLMGRVINSLHVHITPYITGCTGKKQKTLVMEFPIM